MRAVVVLVEAQLRAHPARDRADGQKALVLGTLSGARPVEARSVLVVAARLADAARGAARANKHAMQTQ